MILKNESYTKPYYVSYESHRPKLDHTLAGYCMNNMALKPKGNQLKPRSSKLRND